MRIGLAQMDIIWQDKKQNKEKCLEFIKKADFHGIDLLLFPEMTLTGFSMDTNDLGEGDYLHSPTVEWFRDNACAFNMNIGFGYIEKTEGKGLNNFCIVSSQGKVLSSYSKIHPFSFGEESKFYVGGEDFCITEINDICIGSTVCYDLRFPELYQILSKKAQIIAVIANWPKQRRDAWTTLLKARAIENQCYIAGVNKVGNWGKTAYSGDSMIISPLGEILCSSTEKEELIFADIHKSKVSELRNSFKVKQDRREELYIKGYTENFTSKGDFK